MIYARYGEVWILNEAPKAIRSAARRFSFINNSHDYLFLIIGIDTSGKKVITEACSYASRKDYQFLISKLPMTVEHFSHRVYGPLAPRHGIWKLEEANWRQRGIVSPMKYAWDTIYTGSYGSMKRALMHMERRNKKNVAQYQAVYRLTLSGTLHTDGEGSYRVQMGGCKDYFLTTIPFYGKLYLSSQEQIKKHKDDKRKYYKKRIAPRFL